jgi:hypothetical protein
MDRRALQAECDDLELIGLALLYPALERSVCALGHHGYPRTPDLIQSAGARFEGAAHLFDTEHDAYERRIKGGGERGCRRSFRVSLESAKTMIIQ